MRRTLHYFAVEFWPSAQVQHRFSCAVDAEEGARILAKLAPGVIAYQQYGDGDCDVWDEPDVLARYGTIPLAA